MKRFNVIICLLLVPVIFGSSQETESPTLTGPYLGQKPPGKTPEVFAPGIVSTEEYGEQRCVFSSDGRYLFYTDEGDIYWVSTKVIDELRQEEQK
ncbi:MAG: hypothetical protein JXB26_06070 [Candidatus Aminicenantes bacterium]|nr:hypothetical protein [Candidatus Aminicenantes bacterium]